ncbi:MAG: hypothetical protein IKU20_09805 [Lachnospiraceae bacterium]|nr:hypothetical protein [Lachnospiraceae bacterium]
MRKNLYKGLLFAAMMALSGCSGGSKGQTVSDAAFAELHETYLPEIALDGDFTITYQCKVAHESGTLEGSELGFDLVFDGETLHMPLLDADTYLEYADGTIYEFTAEDKAKGRKEPGSVYSTNKVPSSGVALTVKLSRSGDVISGEGTYEGGAMGKGTHQFWIYHYYSEKTLPETMALKVTGQSLNMSKISYVLE